MSPRLCDYTAYGLHVRSPFTLPFFSPLSGIPHREPDVTVRIGAAPASLPAPADRHGLWEAALGAFLLSVPGVARYLVTDGRDVLVDPHEGRGREAGVFLAGPVFAALLQQRGVVTLHAAAVETGAGAVLIAGRPGTGKSSLIAALVERGYAMLADNVTGVVLGGESRPVALPAFPGLRLWANVLDELAWPRQSLERLRPELEKYLAPVERFRPTPLAVRAVYRLTFGDTDGAEIKTLPVAVACGWLLRSTYRWKFLRGLGQSPTHFRTVTELARRVSVMHVGWPLRSPPFRLDALADRVEEHLRVGGSAASPAETGETPPASRAPSALRTLPALQEGSVSRADTFPRGHEPAAGKAPPGRRRLKPVAVGASRGGPPAASIFWLASYPKSGNTWLRAVLTNYLRDSPERGSCDEPASINALIARPVAVDRETFDELIGLDSSDLTPDEALRHRALFHALLAREAAEPPAEESPRPAFVKVHDACLRTGNGTALFPKAATAGVVYLVRNPLDVAVSYAHQLQGSIDGTVRRMNDPAAAESEVAGGIHIQLPQPMLTWSGHVSSWLGQKALPMHVARYEDLLADPMAAFGAIVRFAGLGHEDGTPARLARAVDHAAFSRLRAQEEECGFSEKQPTAPSFFRAGMAGSWRTALGPRQVRALVDAHGPVMARLGYLREAEAFLAGRAGR